MDRRHQIRIRQIQNIECGIVRNPTRMQHGPHRTITNDGALSESIEKWMIHWWNVPFCEGKRRREDAL
jgi:hypothetical protein